MKHLAASIHFLVTKNARHIKSGTFLQDLSEAQIFNHLRKLAERFEIPD